MEKFELHISETEISTGTVSVGWCVPKSVLDLLKEKGVKDPQVVLVVSPVPTDDNHYSSKEYRKVVPLKDLLGYVEFRTAGPNKIWGFISTMPVKEAKSRYLLKDIDGFAASVLNYSGDDWSFWVNGSDEPLMAEPLSVEVPKECFAPEPSDLEKTWVNWLHYRKAVDQCHFRRRRLFAYTVQPVIFAAAMMVKLLVTLAAFLVGARGLTLKPLIYPFRYDVPAVFENFRGGSVFIRDSDNWFKRYYLLPFMPAIALTLGGLALFIASNPFFLYILLLSLVSVFFMAVLLRGLVYVVKRNINAPANNSSEEEHWYLKEEEVKLMACLPGKKLTSLNDLPAEKRTLKLRFLDLKSKVCKPFSA